MTIIFVIGISIRKKKDFIFSTLKLMEKAFMITNLLIVKVRSKQRTLVIPNEYLIELSIDYLII